MQNKSLQANDQMEFNLQFLYGRVKMSYKFDMIKL